MQFRTLGLLVSLGMIVSACEVGPDYHKPQLPMPGTFSEIDAATAPTTQAATMASATRPIDVDYRNWWTTFNDPELNSLVSRALANNPNLAAAEARIREARGNYGIASSGLYPQVDAQGSYAHSRTPPSVFGASTSGGAGGPNSFVTNSPFISDFWQTGFDATWEVDVFGGTRRAIEAANAGIQAALEDRRDVMISLMAEVAVNYIELRGAQYELTLANSNLSSQQQTLQLIRTQADAGMVPMLNVVQQEAQVDSTAATVPALEAQVRGYIHHIGILLGQTPNAVSDELTAQAPIPVGPPSIPPGLPSDLLRRRPDVRRAERQLAEASANIGVATADLFPKFSVTGSMGLEATEFGKLFNWANRDYSIAPGVQWDIFDAGKVKSNIKVQNALQAAALEAYRAAVLQSLQDVDDALISFNREQKRLQALRDAVTADQKSVDLSKELYEKGSKDFLSVLDAERDLFAAQDAMARSEQQVSADLVALYKALGGGWTEEDFRSK